MRPSSENLIRVLTGSFSAHLIVDSFYGATRTQTDLGADGWELTWNSEADIKSAGTLTIVYTDELARSLSPERFNDTLAPFGQELNLLLEVSAGEFSETVQLGRFLITAVPDARDEHFQLLGQTLTVGSRVTLTLEDRTVRLKRWGFRSDQSPAPLSSCWGEIGRLSGMQIIRSVPDKAAPKSMVYKGVKGGRLAAVQALATQLGGRLYVTPDGALSVLPDGWGEPVAALVLGDNGTILDRGNSMESEEIFNEIVGNFEDENRNPIFVTASVTDGPLAVDGPFGVNTEYITDETITTKHAAQLAVNARLLETTSRQVYRVPVTCIVNPLLEDGDVVTVERPTGGILTGRMVNHRFGDNNTMTLELDVIRG